MEWQVFFWKHLKSLNNIKAMSSGETFFKTTIYKWNTQKLDNSTQNITTLADALSVALGKLGAGLAYYFKI